MYVKRYIKKYFHVPILNYIQDILKHFLLFLLDICKVYILLSKCHPIYFTKYFKTFIASVNKIDLNLYSINLHSLQYVYIFLQVQTLSHHIQLIFCEMRQE